jgi:hypothetical protein
MRKVSLLFIFIMISVYSWAQLSPSKKDTLNTIRTAENLVSGNTKDVLSSFFQLAIDDLTGNDKSFTFSSSIFALQLKSNPSLNLNQRYFNKWSFARNTDVNVALKLDNNYHFNGTSLGMKVAIINKRDIAASRSFVNEVSQAIAPETNTFNTIVQLISGSNYDDATKVKLTTQLNAIVADKKGDLYKNMSDTMKYFFAQAYGEKGMNGIPSESLYTAAKEKFDAIKKTYADKPIVVLGFDGRTFSDQALFSNIDLYLDGTGGIYRSNGKKFDIDIVGKLTFSVQNDSTKPARNLMRSVGQGDAGLNLVFRNKISAPVFELKLAAGYNGVYSDKYASEDASVFTLNGTGRIHVTKDIIIPLTIKYDPAHSNLLGFLSVTSNFDGLSKLLGSKS